MKFWIAHFLELDICQVNPELPHLFQWKLLQVTFGQLEYKALPLLFHGPTQLPFAGYTYFSLQLFPDLKLLYRSCVLPQHYEAIDKKCRHKWSHFAPELAIQRLSGY